MNGKLSLLSAAVLLALTGTTDAATQTTPAATSSPAHNATRVHFKAPLGSTVLYDQTLTGASSGVVDQNFSTAQATHDSAGADDFVVTDATGWTVSTINVEGQYFNGPGPADSFNVNIYPDAAGLPGAVAACAYTALPYTTTGTTPTIAFSIPLSSPCGLAQGTYWVSAVANMSFTPGGEFGWNAYLPATVPGATAKWQNPANGFSTGCTTWGEIPTCLTTVTDNSFSFQIVGHTGNSGGIALTVGLAEDNGNPAQCGTSTNLSATVGDQINFCYTVTNNTTFTLNYQSLADTVSGAIFTNMPQVIAPGASFQYNRIVTAGASESPTSTWTAQDALPGYANSAGSQAFVDISGTGTPLGLGDDSSAAVVMPFSFNFYGATSNQLCINNNGLIEFAAAGTCSGLFGNAALPYSGFTTSVILPFWDDLYTGGNVFTQTIGTTPNRQFIVEYFNKDTFDTHPLTSGYTFEAVFNEVDGTIDFNYQNVNTTPPTPLHDGGLSATVGLQQNSTIANQYSFNTASLTNGQDIHWVPSNPHVFTASQTVTLDVGQPTIFVIPNPLAETAAAGSSVTTPLYLLNTGNRDLNWTVNEFSPQAHFPLVPAIVVPFHAPQDTHAGPVPRAQRTPGLKTHPQIPFAPGAVAVPAFGETFAAGSFNYVSLDASAPGTLNTVATFTNYFFAGTFVNNDFTTEYAVNYPAGDLYTINTASGAQTRIGSTGQGTGVTGIRWDSTTGTTFLMASACGTSSTLYTLDLATGATTAIGSSSGNCIIDIAIDPSGLMYGVDIIADTLVAIDKTTGAAAVIGSIGFNANFAEGLDFDASTGILYFAGVDAGAGNAGNMYTIDTTTGHATAIGPVGPAPGLEMDAFAIAVASGPSCSTPTDVPWLSESPTSGTASPGLYSTVDVTMDATALTPGPYNATVCVHSNDPTNRTVKVPVTFTVTPPVVTDRIFADGFDGP